MSHSFDPALDPAPDFMDDPLSDHPDAGIWRAGFSFDHVKPLIVCRGPIRLEAVRVFERMGTQPCGMLLSEKDSVVYPRALSPELRQVGRNERVHRVPDYMGSGAAEKGERIGQILEIAHRGGYTHLFAGYGFMAEDYEFIAAIERAGLGFIGPRSSVVAQAGAKDAAKTLARRADVSVTPGIDNIEALALLSQADAEPGVWLEQLAARHDLPTGGAAQAGGLATGGLATGGPEILAERLLEAARERKLELVPLPVLIAEAQRRVDELLALHPGKRLRLKHVGGGGGKGQRIVTATAEVPAAVNEVLAEAKATAPGDNRNFLIELNIEATRHNEIQLLGNGVWCIALGGRDCSLQMHEQKLLEVSITEDLLERSAAAFEGQGRAKAAKALRADAQVLREMEAEAERFGEAVGLDSASTFESIVDGRQHYFMEVNTRIQVEHRVTEMVYGLRFTHPERPEQQFGVDSLVEAMLWTAVHGPSLPRPERIPRYGSGAEARINATNDALKPHAGGIVLDWSPPREDELRDDQGIGIRNPDTGEFMPYHLAGAYDSNLALLVTHGSNREDNFRRLAEILRVTDLRGWDLRTNYDFHYGLLHWMLGADPMVKPTTAFTQGYLAGVGALREAGRELDLDLAWDGLLARCEGLGREALQALSRKRTLILRPLRQLYSHPHLLAGWLAPRAERRHVITSGQVVWLRNPLEVLEALYGYLHLEEHPGVSPEDCIWPDDNGVLQAGLAFYRELGVRLAAAAGAGAGGAGGWQELDALLADSRPPQGFSAAEWSRVQAAHRGQQSGLTLLKLPVLSGEESGFYGMRVDEALEVVMPERFRDPAQAAALRLALDDAPSAKSNQVMAFTGGTFYDRPSPEEATYVQVGQRVEKGTVLGLLEVMKMFNPVRAEFSGVVTQVHIHGEGGHLVQKGQPLFELEPEVPFVHETEAERLARRRHKTDQLLERL